MTLPREHLVSVSDTPYYHVVSRCVRRAFLCGEDRETGKNYEHRRQWIEDRIRLLSSIFAIEICAYSVMSNHVHIVLKLLPDETQNWSQFDLFTRWACIFKGPSVMQKHLKNEPLKEFEYALLKQYEETYRERLSSLSWFMKCLNEPIARQANKEDNCTGHFWESRFKSQALLSEEALLSCMAYVDLNPVRASMVDTPETSDYTSIKERIEPVFNIDSAVEHQSDEMPIRGRPFHIRPLAKFNTNTGKQFTSELPISFQDYLDLVDTTGRVVQEDKRGAIAENLPNILARLEIAPENWFEQSAKFEQVYHKRFAKPKRRFDRTG